MNPELFVRVWKFRDGKRIGSGTGYWIGPERILTSGHVARGADRFEIESSAFPKPLGATRIWCGLTEEDDARDLEKLDAALLVPERPLTPRSGPWPRLASTPLIKAANYNTRGFAVVTRQLADGLQGFMPLFGAIQPFSRDESFFHVSIEVPTEQVEQAKGISGAPILVDNLLVGVLRQIPSGFDGSLCQAVSLPKLLLNEDFCKKTAREAMLAQLDGLRELVLQRLEHSKDTFEILLEVKPTWRPEPGSGQVEAFADALLNQPFAEVVEALDDAWIKAVERVLPNVERALDQLLDLVLPFLYLQQFGSVGSNESVLVGLPVATRTFAEIAMASRDGRGTRFRVPRNRLRKQFEPVSEGEVEVPPEEGPKRGQKDAGNVVVGVFDRLVLELADRFVFQEDLDALRQDPQKVDYLAALINKHFEVSATRGTQKMTWFFVVQPHHSKDLVSRLGQLLPAVKLVELKGDNQSRVTERILCHRLFEMLKRRPGRK